MRATCLHTCRALAPAPVILGRMRWLAYGNVVIDPVSPLHGEHGVDW